MPVLPYMLLMLIFQAEIGFAAEGLLIGPAPPPIPKHGGTLGQLRLTPGVDGTLLREPPALSLSGRHTVMPFLGFGFSRGTTTDMSGTMMRGVMQQGTLQDDHVLRDVAAKSVMPNEVQLGIRLPF